MADYGFKYKRTTSTPTPYGTVGGDADEATFCERNVGGQYSIKKGETVALNTAWTRSLTKVICMSTKKDKNDSTQGNLPNITLKSNSTSSPDDTETLVPGVGVEWFSELDPAANMPFPTADVTQIYATNAGNVDMILTLAVGGDPS